MDKHYIEMTDEEYNKIGGYRSTGVKSILKYGMFDYLQPEGVKRGGVALDFGIYFHTLVLEPEKINDLYALPIEVERPELVGLNKLTTEYKQAKKLYDLENIDLIITTLEDHKLAHNMREVVMKRYGKIIERAKREVVFTYKDENGIRRSCKVDIYDEQTGNFFDLKSTAEEVDLKNIRYVSSKYGYDTSASWYYDAIRGAGADPKGFGLLFSSKADYRALLYKPSNFFLEIGRQKYGVAYEKILAYEKEGIVSDAFMELDPSYNELKAYGYVE